jgi:hypothetical protein
MPLVGFEPTIKALERVKKVHVLDCAANVIGTCISNRVCDIAYTWIPRCLISIYEENGDSLEQLVIFKHFSDSIGS